MSGEKLTRAVFFFFFQIPELFLAIYCDICVYNAFMSIIAYDGDDICVCVCVCVWLYPHLRHYSILDFVWPPMGLGNALD